MLKSLYVENYALIDKLNLDFSKSLNIITGETGAGKSILLGALGLLLGDRADAINIKDETRSCIVEGVFSIREYSLEFFFKEHDLEYEPNTVIRRVLSPGGKSRAYINDLPVQLSILREFSSYIIDIHSQHQSLMIAQDGFRINILDSVAGHKALVDSYGEKFQTIRSCEHKLKQLRIDVEQSRKDEEWLAFQVNELEAAKLKRGELDDLEERQSELAHSEEIRDVLALAIGYLGEDESGIISHLSQIEGRLKHIVKYYPVAEQLNERIRSSMLELQDVERELSSEIERIDSDPVLLQKLNNRLDTLYSLTHKHRVETVEELIKLYDDYKARLDLLSSDDASISKLEKHIETLRKEAYALAAEISKGRKTASQKLTKHVETTLEGLGMPGSRFVVEIDVSQELRASGIDDIKFMFSANKNIAPAPVEKIASGGEISRLMLSIKSLVAESGKLPTIIFDEIDAGVSGHIADAMGNIIVNLSKTMQVINITHLPQVASKGDTHFYVYKEADSPTAQTLIKLLSKEERIGEISKMLSGSKITDAAIKQAKLLLEIF